jgi:hypothetical protein
MKYTSLALFLTLFAFSFVYAQNTPNVKWVNSIGSTGSDMGTSIHYDTAGNVYTAGRFAGTTTFGSTRLTSAGNTDIYVMKQDALGKISWVKQFGGAGYDQPNDLVVATNGSIYLCGLFSGTVYLQNDTIKSNGNSDIFVQKLDTTGNSVWIKATGSAYLDEASGIAIDSNENVYTVGRFQSTVAFGTFSLTAINEDVFIQKMD